MMIRDDDSMKACNFCYTKKCEVKEILSKYRDNEDIPILIKKIASQCNNFTSHQDETDRINADILNNSFSTTKREEPTISEGEAVYIVGQSLYDRIKKLESKVEPILTETDDYRYSIYDEDYDVSCDTCKKPGCFVWLKLNSKIETFLLQLNVASYNNKTISEVKKAIAKNCTFCGLLSKKET